MNLSELRWNEAVDLVLKSLVLAGGVIGFIAGRREYRRGQRWHKAQILLSLIDSFEKDPRITSACRMLDWDARNVKLPDGSSINFSNDKLWNALRSPEKDTEGNDSADPDAFTSEEIQIKDCLDAFFDFFQKPYAFWKSGLLEFEDFTYFLYWFNLLHFLDEYKKIEAGKVFKALLETYLNCYGFVGISELLKKYETTKPVKMPLGKPTPPVSDKSAP